LRECARSDSYNLIASRNLNTFQALHINRDAIVHIVESSVGIVTSAFDSKPRAIVFLQDAKGDRNILS
jgi:predicted oxidoreductase (fatty acid repression mutant protein)